LYSIKSRNPSALSNSAASVLEGRRAAALPNNPNCMMRAPLLCIGQSKGSGVMLKMPVFYHRHSMTA
jgi:hypothetical protein